ncbi:hypothetical protein [uncultured Bacteroides sp.]|nr:hypothetical protein [uncultured Bacteroides sp.]
MKTKLQKKEQNGNLTIKTKKDTQIKRKNSIFYHSDNQALNDNHDE